MKRKKFTILESTCVPLPQTNIDTDQIIPARFLNSVTREGFGKNLFRDWRYDNEGKAIKEFILNNPVYKGNILVTGSNFGCGSSREHAVWAIADYGFRAVVSDSFADIFANNALNNGLLPVAIPAEPLRRLTELIISKPGTKVKIDLEKQVLSSEEAGISVSFAINAFKKECLLKGLDNIDYLLGISDEITAFEERRST
ncbi:MAG: 3-isopropylmalate dehydratase small subunit [Bacteroidales bacterium]|nr:3-isopropylmalate dehydratase small subunit [Bacteroidales bacterium]